MGRRISARLQVPVNSPCPNALGSTKTFSDMWSAVANEERHRFGIGGPAGEQSAVAASLCRAHSIADFGTAYNWDNVGVLLTAVVVKSSQKLYPRLMRGVLCSASGYCSYVLVLNHFHAQKYEEGMGHLLSYRKSTE
jgi:hypothetical protein